MTRWMASGISRNGEFLSVSSTAQQFFTPALIAILRSSTKPSSEPHGCSLPQVSSSLIWLMAWTFLSHHRMLLGSIVCWSELASSAPWMAALPRR